jgi:cellulose synthase/poly-beta-1,6-N-acetylglucosamine synthase-like glycosyltransferase
VLVLDCDMILHPDFLRIMLGHFYKQVMFKLVLLHSILALSAASTSK